MNPIKLPDKIVVINVGVITFLEELCKQDVEAIQVDWRPPLEDSEELQEILERLQ